MANWSAFGTCRRDFQGGAPIDDAQIDDIFALLDKDGDGSIDYQEFARWFGAGPPPPPMLPEIKLRLDAQQDAGGAAQVTIAIKV